MATISHTFSKTPHHKTEKAKSTEGNGSEKLQHGFKMNLALASGLKTHLSKIDVSACEEAQMDAKVNQFEKEMRELTEAFYVAKEQLDQGKHILRQHMGDIELDFAKDERIKLCMDQYDPKIQNLYTHIVDFYALLNETYAKLKTAANELKRDDKTEVKSKQDKKTFWARAQFVMEVTTGLAASLTAATGNELGRIIAEFGISKLSSAGGALMNNESQQLEHGIQTLDKKIDDSSQRKRSISENESAMRRALKEALDGYKRAFGDGRIAGG